MSIRALNRWRWVFLAYWVMCLTMRGRLRGRRFPRIAGACLVGGATLWLVHDLAHGRWRIGATDALALGALRCSLPWAGALAVALACLRPEREPSPHLWSGWLAARRHMVHLQRQL